MNSRNHVLLVSSLILATNVCTSLCAMPAVQTASSAAKHEKSGTQQIPKHVTSKKNTKRVVHRNSSLNTKIIEALNKKMQSDLNFKQDLKALINEMKAMAKNTQGQVVVNVNDKKEEPKKPWLQKQLSDKAELAGNVAVIGGTTLALLWISGLWGVVRGVGDTARVVGDTVGLAGDIIHVVGAPIRLIRYYAFGR